MNRLIALWQGLGQIEQSVIAVVLMVSVYVFFRLIIIHRLERFAAKTDNDLDDRLVHFVKQFLWVIALFVSLAIVIRINHIKISPLLAGAGIFGVALGFAAKALGCLG